MKEKAVGCISTQEKVHEYVIKAILFILGISVFHEGLYGGFYKKKKYLINLHQTSGCSARISNSILKSTSKYHFL